MQKNDSSCRVSDLVQRGYFKIRNQGAIGSSCAYSVASAMEYVRAIEMDSEQEMVRPPEVPIHPPTRREVLYQRIGGQISGNAT